MQLSMFDGKQMKIDKPTKIETAHCLFEQSGTFKNEFKKLGINAYDYDILNDFGETDFQIDLFSEIEKAYGGGGLCLIILRETILCLPFSLARDLKIKPSCFLGER